MLYTAGSSTPPLMHTAPPPRAVFGQGLYSPDGLAVGVCLQNLRHK